MASATHEGIVILFRERPSLALDLLGAAGLAAPLTWEAVFIEDASFPQSAPSHRADLVTTFHDGAGRRVLAAIVEVQLAHDADKPWTWPLYWSAVRARMRCPVALVVVCVSRRIARWARRALSQTLASGRYGPWVLGPDHIPRITDPEAARAAPELAVLSSMVHGNEPDGVHIAAAALGAAARLDAPRAALYHDLVRHRLNAAATAALEALMGYQGYEYQSDFARKYFGEGRAAGVAEGRAAGVAEGRAAGVAEGVAEGRVEGAAAALLSILAARGLTPDDAQLVRIRGCRDAAVLQAWVERAVHAETVQAILG